MKKALELYCNKVFMILNYFNLCVYTLTLNALTMCVIIIPIYV